MSGKAPDGLQVIVDGLANKLNSDFFLVSAGISDRCGNKFLEVVRQIKNKRPKASLILTTNGGSADAAYQMARCIKKHYSKFSLYVFGYCKSAGTLIAVGADEIIMSEFGQFGPLDVQLADKKEMYGQTPALEVSQALTTLSESSFTFFTNHLFNMGPGQSISTSAAITIAQSLTLGIIQPIASQIDPLLLGRVERSMRIAKAYSARLNKNFINIKKLVEDYPSHEFVIDCIEAKSLFPVVREPNSDETKLEELLRELKCIPYQSENNIITALSTEATNEEKLDENTSESKNNEANTQARNHISANKAEPISPSGRPKQKPVS
jgi:hypothetical protein